MLFIVSQNLPSLLLYNYFMNSIFQTTYSHSGYVYVCNETFFLRMEENLGYHISITKSWGILYEYPIALFYKTTRNYLCCIILCKLKYLKLFFSVYKAVSSTLKSTYTSALIKIKHTYLPHFQNLVLYVRNQYTYRPKHFACN